MKTWIFSFIFLVSLSSYFLRENLMLEKKISNIKVTESQESRLRLEEAGEAARKKVMFEHRKEALAYEMMFRRLKKAEKDVKNLQKSL